MAIRLNFNSQVTHSEALIQTFVRIFVLLCKRTFYTRVDQSQRFWCQTLFREKIWLTLELDSFCKMRSFRE